MLPEGRNDAVGQLELQQLWYIHSKVPQTGVWCVHFQLQEVNLVKVIYTSQLSLDDQTNIFISVRNLIWRIRKTTWELKKRQEWRNTMTLVTEGALSETPVSIFMLGRWLTKTGNYNVQLMGGFQRWPVVHWIN